MTDGVTVVAGLPIPSTSPVFLAVVAFHVVAGLACVVSGAVAMLSRKGRGRHSKAGTIYFAGLIALFVSSAFLAAVRWAEDYPLFVLAAAAMASAYVGRWAMRRLGSGRTRLHIGGMGGSYLILLTAFYVDNGKNLPLWRELPPIAYWTVPTALGLPIMIWALLRHPVVLRDLELR